MLLIIYHCPFPLNPGISIRLLPPCHDSQLVSKRNSALDYPTRSIATQVKKLFWILIGFALSCLATLTASLSTAPSSLSSPVQFPSLFLSMHFSFNPFRPNKFRLGSENLRAPLYTHSVCGCIYSGLSAPLRAWFLNISWEFPFQRQQPVIFYSS
jgi:hypothetical protein